MIITRTNNLEDGVNKIINDTQKFNKSTVTKTIQDNNEITFSLSQILETPPPLQATTRRFGVKDFHFEN